MAVLEGGLFLFFGIGLLRMDYQAVGTGSAILLVLASKGA